MSRWAYVLPVMVAVLFLLPHVFDAYFGLLDDAITLQNGRKVLQEPLRPFVATRSTGRFFPMYQYYYTAVRLVVGELAAGFYFMNLAALCAIVTSLVWSARGWGGKESQGALTGVLFILALPTVTTFHTLSKAEVPQGIFLAAGMAACASARAGRVIRGISGAGCVLLAVWSKETAYAVAVAAGLAFASTGWRLRSWGGALRSRQGLLLASSAAGTAMALLSWKIAHPSGITPGSYGAQYQLSAERLIANVWDMAGYVIRSGAYLLPALVALPFAWRKLDDASRVVVVEGTIWCGCFLAVLAPWPVVFEYQMMPAMMGLAAVGGFLIPALWGLGGRYRIASLGAAAILPLHLVNAMGSADTQRTIDRANGLMVQRLASLPKGAKAFLNVPPSEYVYEAKLQVEEMLHRPDISVDSLPYDHRTAAPAGEEVLIASPRVEGLRHVLIRVGFRDDDSAMWSSMLDDYLAPDGTKWREGVIEGSAEVSDFAFQKLLCFPGVKSGGIPCRQPGPLYTHNVVKSAWHIYRMARKPTAAPVPARFLPGGTWEFRQPGGTIRRVSLGESGDIPLRGDFDGDGWDEIGVFRPADGTWRIDLNMDGRPERVFRFPGMLGTDLPVVGDWDGNRSDTPGFFRPAENRWVLSNHADGATKDLEIAGFGEQGDEPVAGDWFGTGRSIIGFYRRSTGELILRLSNEPGDTHRGVLLERGGHAVIADWCGTGKDFAALYKEGKLMPRPLNSEGAPFTAPKPIVLEEGGVALAGNWKPPP